jgi:hypothetical protein
VSTAAVERETRQRPPAIVVVSIFVVLAFVESFRDISRLRTFVAGDSGDSILNLWIMRSVQRGLPHGWHALWDAPIFYPAKTTLAYSETLFPPAIVDWPLRVVFGDVMAYNLIYLASWVLASWCMYRLALRFVQDWRAGFVAALAYTYSSIVLVHTGHFQLVVGSALLPLTVLALLNLLDDPSFVRGALLGVSFATLALSASYYGAMSAVIIAIVAGGWLLTTRPKQMRRYVQAFAVAAVMVAVIAGPFAYEYVQLQRQPEFRRGFDASSAAHVGDFAATGSSNYLLTHLPVISSHSTANSRLIENRLFPGCVALIFGVMGLVVLIRRLRKTGWRTPPANTLALITLAGIACVILAFGDRIVISHHKIPLPFAVFRHFIPGFSGIRATARLVLGGELALALLAAVGVEKTLHTTKPSFRAPLTVALTIFVVAETAMGVTMVRVPTAGDDGGVARALRYDPKGVVLELPIASAASGITWPYVEAPRQLEALRDGDPRINGYSGFQPKDFDQIAATLNTFPEQGALNEARSLGVRYIVLRTEPIGTLTPSVLEPRVDKNGAGLYDDATARDIINRLPPGTARNVERVAGGYIIDLGT